MTRRVRSGSACIPILVVFLLSFVLAGLGETVDGYAVLMESIPMLGTTRTYRSTMFT